MAVDKAKRFQTMDELRVALETLPVAVSSLRMARIDAFLKLGAAQGCSDVHLAVGVPPMLRMNGDLMPIKFRDLGDSGARGLRHRDPERDARRTSFRKGNDSTSPTCPTTAARFRVNVFRKDTGVGAMFRTIPAEVPTLDSLELPPIVKKLCDYHQGMVLVTGSTGTGKSTTLAAMIDHLNTTQEAQHHQPRRPDRVRPPQQAEPGHPARAAHAPAVASPKACARRCARTRT